MLIIFYGDANFSVSYVQILTVVPVSRKVIFCIYL